MNSTNRIIVNTLVQYVRSVVYTLLALFSTRFVLEALGHSAYGVYVVIGSVVYMMGFVTQSLATSTQRFLSFSHGLADKGELRKVFTNAMFLHGCVALLIVLAMTVLEPVCMHYLVIPLELASSARFVYFMVVLMVMLTFVTAPVRALFISRENIVYVSIIEMVDAVLKLAGAIVLPFITYDALRLYATILVAITAFNFFAYYIYARWHYDECSGLRFKEITFASVRKLMSFAVWNVYAVGATVVRTQGLSVILNRFMGTLANAGYGIALQVSNAAGFIAVSILNAVNPQLMKAEGAGDRKRMLHLSMIESRYAFLVMALVLLPVIVEMEAILHFWLGDVPEYAVMFCRYLLSAYILDQLTIGLTSVNQAIGRIRNYSLLISTIRLLTLPVAWLCLKVGLPLHSVMWTYLVVEFVIGVIRIPFMKFTAGLPVMEYIRTVIVQTMLPVAGTFVCSLSIMCCVQFPYRFLLTECVSVLVGVALVYLFTLNCAERSWLHEKVKQIRQKL